MQYANAVVGMKVGQGIGWCGGEREREGLCGWMDILMVDYILSILYII